MSEQRANVIAFIEKGLHCFSIGQFDEARYFWNQALALDPHNAQVLEFLQYVSPQQASATPSGGVQASYSTPARGYDKEVEPNPGHQGALRWNSGPSVSQFSADSDASVYSGAQEAWLPQEEDLPPWGGNSDSQEQHPFFHQADDSGDLKPPISSVPPSLPSKENGAPASPLSESEGGWLEQGLYPSSSNSSRPNRRGLDEPARETKLFVPVAKKLSPHELIDEHTVQSPVPLMDYDSMTPPSQGEASYYGKASGRHVFHDDLAAPADAFSSELPPPKPLPPENPLEDVSHDLLHSDVGPTDDEIRPPIFEILQRNEGVDPMLLGNSLVPSSAENFLPPEEVLLDASGEFFSSPYDNNTYLYSTPPPVGDISGEVPFFQEEPLDREWDSAHFEQDGSLANARAESDVSFLEQESVHADAQNESLSPFPSLGDSQDGSSGEPISDAIGLSHSGSGEAVAHVFQEPGEDSASASAYDSSVVDDEEWADIDDDEIMEVLSDDSVELVFEEDFNAMFDESSNELGVEVYRDGAGTNPEQPTVAPNSSSYGEAFLGESDTPPAGVDAFQPSAPPVHVFQSEPQESKAEAFYVVEASTEAYSANGESTLEPTYASPVDESLMDSIEDAVDDASNVFEMPSSAASSDNLVNLNAEFEEVSILLSGIEDLLAEEDFVGAKELLDVVIQQEPENQKIKILYELCEKKVAEIFREEVQSLDAVPKMAMNMNDVLGLRLNHRDGYILSQIDGFTSISDLLAISGFGEDELFMILGQLVHRGVVEWA